MQVKKRAGTKVKEFYGAIQPGDGGERQGAEGGHEAIVRQGLGGGQGGAKKGCCVNKVDRGIKFHVKSKVRDRYFGNSLAFL